MQHRCCPHPNRTHLGRRVGLSRCVLCGIQFLGSSCVTASVFSTLKTIYGKHEGPGFVVGVGKGWVGLFGAIVTQLYKYTVRANSAAAHSALRCDVQQCSRPRFFK